MKELSQIRMAVLDALRGAGIQAMEVFPEKQAMAYSGVVAAVGVYRGCQGEGQGDPPGAGALSNRLFRL